MRVRASGCIGLPDDTHADVAWYDADTSSVVDLGALEESEEREFRRKRRGVDPALAEAVRGMRASDRVDVNVWFATDLRDIPAKDIVLADRASAFERMALISERISAARSDLQRQLADLGISARHVHASAGSGAPSAPFVSLEAEVADLEKLGELPGVVRVFSALEADEELPASEDYIAHDFIDWLRFWTGGSGTWNGTGVVVADIEGSMPDSWVNLPGPAGNCSGRACFCASGTTNWHARAAMGLVRNSATTFQGTASEASTIMANFQNGGCGSLDQAVDWARLSFGAPVMLRPCCDAAGPTSSAQASRDIYFDYVAKWLFPYPLFVTATGNQRTGVRPYYNLRNGVAVGAADNTGQPNRKAVTLAAATQDANWPAGASGWEMPHLVAPGGLVDTAGATAGASWTVGSPGATSYAAPQVAGMAASILEGNPSLSGWPEALIVGLLVGADEDVDGLAWPLNLADAVDDRDGVGLINALASGAALAPSAKRNGGNPAAQFGHDFGPISTPAGTYYSETYNLQAAPGETVRVAATLFSAPACTLPATPTSCSSNPFPAFWLVVIRTSDGQATVSANVNQTWQYVAVTNGGGITQNYTARILPVSWPTGTSPTTYGIAWASTVLP